MDGNFNVFYGMSLVLEIIYYPLILFLEWIIPFENRSGWRAQNKSNLFVTPSCFIVLPSVGEIRQEIARRYKTELGTVRFALLP